MGKRRTAEPVRLGAEPGTAADRREKVMGRREKGTERGKWGSGERLELLDLQRNHGETEKKKKKKRLLPDQTTEGGR